jgi:tetratricopeptide (TPR) repeat protein
MCIEVRAVWICLIGFFVGTSVQAQTAADWAARAEQSIRQGNQEDALKALVQAAAARPQTAASEDRIGFLLVVLHQPAHEAIVHFRKAIAHDPHYAAAHFHLGAVLMIAKQPGPGLAELRKAARLAPGVFEYQYKLGSALQTKGDLAGASKAYGRAVALKPDDDKLRNQYAYLLIATRQARRGIEESKRVLAHQPSNVAALMNIGYAYLQTGDSDEAEKTYRRLLAADPKSAAAHYDLGLALKMKDALAPAKAELQTAIRLDPSFAQAYYSLGIIDWQNGNFPEAIKQIRAALAINKNYAQAHYMLGIVLKQTGDLDDALSELKEAIRLDPSTPGPYNTIGEILSIQGDKQGSKEAFAAGARLKHQADAELAHSLDRGMRGGEVLKPVVSAPQ